MVINEFLSYCLNKNLIVIRDVIFFQNQISALLDIEEVAPFEKVENIRHIDDILAAIATKYSTESMPSLQECLKSKVMSLVMARPSEIEQVFYGFEDAKDRTDYFYQYCKDVNYIKEKQVAKNIHYHYASEYGLVDITINCSKPEKDPKEIAMLKASESTSSFIKCPLCIENEGFIGNISKADRSNHRMITMPLNQESYYFQYSPYSYFEQHSILISEKHQDMVINADTFTKLIDFVDQYPHYFVGSNADLPIVGGSLLTHDHYQAGVHEFALNRACSIYDFSVGLTKVEVLKWPMSCIKLSSHDAKDVLVHVNRLFEDWCQFTDLDKDILSHTGELRHNTVTPIVRKVSGIYEVIIVLRNNRCNEAYPDGIFHPHPNKHHVKKENIGLIEVMGLAVLPERLLQVKACLLEVIQNNASLPQELEAFEDMLNMARMSDVPATTIDEQIAIVFMDVLKDCAVFKQEQDLIEYIKRVFA